MLKETVELTLSHVDLGTLSEFAAMALFGNAISHCITRGRGRSTREITDVEGHLLYPAYYMTHLRVPPKHLLQRYQVWDNVEIGVDVRSFGGMMLDSRYILGPPGAFKEDASTWNTDAFPTMRGGTLFVVEDSRGENSRPGKPRSDHVAELPKLTTRPESSVQYNKVLSTGTLVPGFKGNLRARSPISYPLVTGRDVIPGHSMMFATYNRLMEYAERELLTNHVWPPFPLSLLDHRSILERETYYLNNAQVGETVTIDIRGEYKPCSDDLFDDRSDLIPGGQLTFALEVYAERRNSLLLASQVKKILAIPASQRGAVRDAERLISSLKESTA